MSMDLALNYLKNKSPCENILITSLPPYLSSYMSIKFQFVKA